MRLREQGRIGVELRTIESRQGVLDGWLDVMDLALRFSTRCATGYRRAGDRTRKLFNAAVLNEVHVRDGHVVDAAYEEPFDLLFSSPKFGYGDVVVKTMSYSNFAQLAERVAALARAWLDGARTPFTGAQLPTSSASRASSTRPATPSVT
ncbi:MAG: hypothetical protein M0Z88_10460 [Actinomycetota bacterium]|nr:hypothetical protein [Actinomycetota bacterium]